MTRYRTIVADPPWHYTGFGTVRTDGTGAKRTTTNAKGGRMGVFIRNPLPYPSMTLDEIRSLPVSSLCLADAHLYLWATQRYLWDAPSVARAWGFQPSCVLTWCKPRGGIHGGAFSSNTEFVLFCRRGRLPANRVDSQWYEWRRGGNGGHSRKPEAFLDLVEQVSPGPYLELFARRQRLGWDTWGDEALQHVEVAP